MNAIIKYPIPRMNPDNILPMYLSMAIGMPIKSPRSFTMRSPSISFPGVPPFVPSSHIVSTTTANETKYINDIIPVAYNSPNCMSAAGMPNINPSSNAAKNLIQNPAYSVMFIFLL